jgi:WD40 repeat protein
MAEDSVGVSYHAFISYSHRDTGWGEWLHKGLERYKVPKPLVGRSTERGDPVPARIYPVFRDREELPTAVDLGEIIARALAQSRYLIVICSPASARSKWVNQEILEFKRLGGENRVLAIIVDGEPNASVGKADFPADLECFPEALRFKLGNDGTLSKEPTEPIAADARRHGDGKEDALLKLVAGILGVGYAELKRRDEVQRRRRQRFVMVTISSVALVVSGLGLMAFIQRSIALEQKKLAQDNANEATRQRNEAVSQRKEAQFNMAQAELALARHWLETGEAAKAVGTSLRAIDASEESDRHIDAVWPVLRRALDLRQVDMEWPAHRGEVDSISFDGSGERLLTVCREAGEIAVWSAHDGTLLVRIPCKQVALAAWTSDDSQIVTLEAGQSPGLCWRDPATGEILMRKNVPDFADDIDLSPGDPDPKWIANTRFTDGIAHSVMIRLEDGFSDWSVPVKQGEISRTRFLPDVGVALRIESNTGVGVISLKDGTEISRFEGINTFKDLDLASIVPSADLTRIAAVVIDNDQPASVGVWRLSDGKRLVEFEPGGASAFDIWFYLTPDGRLAGKLEPLLAAISGPLSRISLTVESSGPLLAWAEGTPESGPVALSTRSVGRLASPQVSIIYPQSGLESEISGPGMGLTDLAVAPCGKRVAVSSKGGTIQFWQLAKPPVEPEPTFPATVEVVAVAENTGHLLLKAADSVIVWDVGRRRILSTMPATSPEAVTTDSATDARYHWNASAEWLAVTRLAEDEADTGSVLFYHTGTGALLGEYRLQTRYPEIILAPRGHRALIRTGHFSADLVVGNNGGIQAHPLPFSGNDPPEAAFSADGEKVYISPRPGWLEIISSSTGRSERKIKLGDDETWSPRVSALVVHPSGGELLAGTSGKWLRVDFRMETSTEMEADFDLLARPAFVGDGHLLMSRVGTRLHWWQWPNLRPVGDTEASFDPFACDPLPGHDLLLLRDPHLLLRSCVVVEQQGGHQGLVLDNVVGISPALGLAATQETESFRVVRLHDGEILAEVQSLRVSQACFAPDGSRVGVVLSDNSRYVSLPLVANRALLLERARRLVPSY